jgi:hypothetical protein
MPMIIFEVSGTVTNKIKSGKENVFELTEGYSYYVDTLCK